MKKDIISWFLRDHRFGKPLSVGNLVAIPLFLAMASTVDAVITGNVIFGEPDTTVVVTQLSSGKFDVDITKQGNAQPTGDTGVLIRTTAGEEIRDINVANFENNILLIFVRGSDGQLLNAPSAIEQTRVTVNQGAIIYAELWVDGNLGRLEANRWNGGTINGDVTGPVIMLDYPGSLVPGIFSSPTPPAINGDVLGDIIVDGVIQTDLQIMGRLGLPGSPSIVAVRDEIQRIVAGEINATFVDNLGTGPVPNIASIATDTANGGSGDFNGLIYAGNIDSFSGQSPEFVFDGDMNGDIWIGESLDSGDLIEVSAGALKGQVIIGFDITPGTATWNGVVSVGGSALAGPPFYSDLPSAIGGGAVGLVPFSNHGPASTPPAQTNVTLANTPGPTNPIILEHYGEVFFNQDPDTEPVLVFIEPCEFTNAALSVDCYTTAPDPTNPRALIVTLDEPVPNGWRVRIKPSLSTTGDYTELQSAVDGTPFWPIADYEYAITVGTCPSDFNGDGLIDSSDLGTLLGAFGSSASGCAYQVGDVNGDGIVDTNDLGILLAAFGGPCDSCSFAGAFSMMSGTPATPWIIETIGFQSVEEFMAAFVNLNEQEQMNIIELMLGLID